MLTGNSLETDLSVAIGQERKRRSGDWCGTIQKNRGVPVGIGTQRAARLAGDPGVGGYLDRGDLDRLSRSVLTRSATLRLILRLSEFAAGPGLASLAEHASRMSSVIGQSRSLLSQLTAARLGARTSEFAISPGLVPRLAAQASEFAIGPGLGPRLAARPCGVRRSRRSTGPARQPRDPRG